MQKEHYIEVSDYIYIDYKYLAWKITLTYQIAVISLNFEVLNNALLFEN